MKKSKLVTLLTLVLFSFSVLVNGCGSSTTDTNVADSQTAVSADSSEAVSSTEKVTENDSTEASAVTFTFTVVDADGNETATDITTSEAFLAGALAKEGIISEEEAAAGYVTIVNGITADYEADEAWWCLTDETGEATTVGISEIGRAHV